MVREILRPTTMRGALRMGRRPGAAWLGGGTWLNSRLGGEPEVLVSLSRLGLGTIEETGAGCRLGAMATFQQILDDPRVPDAVRRAAGLTAARTLRNMATVGGELGLRPHGSVLIPVLIALYAKVRVAGTWALRNVEEYCREAGGLVLGVHIADPRPCAVEALSLTSRSRKTLVVAVSVRGGGKEQALRGVRIVASDGCGQLLRLRAVEESMDGRPLPPKEDIEKAVCAAFWPNPDIHASGAYKRYMAGVLAADLLHALAGAMP